MLRLLLLLLPVLTSAIFHDDFYNFLVNKYGVDVADDMNQANNPWFSYGGGNSTSGYVVVIVAAAVVAANNHNTERDQ